LEQTTTRKVAWSQLSTKIHSDWTFTSGSAARGRLPLMDLAISASGLDQRNRAGTGPVGLTVVPSTRQVTAAGTVRTLEWSADDGATWTDLPFAESGRGVAASLRVPDTAAFVALRVTAGNDQGGTLSRTVLRAIAGPATARDETVGGVTISNVKVNYDRGLILGTSGTVPMTATFTASAPSGIEGGGLYLWHGAYNTPDGVQTATTECRAVNTTTANCTASLYIWDVRYLFSSNALAGTWRASVWATAKDGVGLADRHSAGSVVIKRATRLSANAGPEPVKKRKKVTVTGLLARADWTTGPYGPYPYRAVVLQWIKRGAKKWVNVKTVRSDAKGRLTATDKARADGSYRFVYVTDSTSAGAVSAADYVDVR
jgi:hypothetical protein